jgi:predicted enzyme related to lactoylglutathione lyase
LVNVPGAWNFSHLHTTNEHSARTFYATVFGWHYDDVPGGGAAIRVPGYGNHLAATVDPGIYQRQAGAPPGFADVIGGLQTTGLDEHPHWHVTFSVDDRDASAATAERLSATVLSTSESPWARFADIRDPQGAEFTISQFRPG